MDNVHQICRICLSVNVKMYILKNTNIENLYKLLTQAYVDMEDGKPTTVCFLCYARLQQCNRLQQQAIKSNELLEQLLKEGFMQATANAILNNQHTSQDLQVSTTYYLDLEPASCEDILLHPKVETESFLSVKKEEVAIDEECNVTDFSEDANDPNDFAPETIYYNSDDNPLITIGSNKCDGINNFAYGVKQRKQQEKEHQCIIQLEKKVKNHPHLSNCNQIQQKYKTSNNNEGAKGIHIKSERSLEKRKSKFVMKKQTFQKPINNDEDARVDMKSKRKLEKMKTNEISNKPKNQKSIHNKQQKENINNPVTTAINTITYKFQCNECGEQFSNKNILTDHILNCMKTTETTVSDSQLTKANMLKPLLSEMYSCDYCAFKTYQKRFMETHLKMHKVTRVFSCNICEYRCPSKSKLIQHSKIHTGEKPFSCNICEYRCARKVNLKQHLIIHTGEKPFFCNICGYRCARNVHLKEHVRTHTGEKPFSCNMCKFRCASKSSLSRHQKNHTSEKTFCCNMCEYQCILKRDLKKHIETHTGEKSFT